MRYLIIMFSVLLASCGESSNHQKTSYLSSTPITTQDYQLHKAQNQKALLIVFPCFPCDAQNTYNEFNIVDISLKNNISVLLLNFNMHLSLSNQEKINISNLITETIKSNNLPSENIFLGGFSGGGNVTLLMTNYLIETKNKIQPKGAFIVDAPIDLVQLYTTAKSNIADDFSEVSVEEARWIVNLFDSEFGNPDTSMNNYIQHSPYITNSHSLKNVRSLKNLKLRFYTEPDTTWWRENRHVTYEQMNAFAIQNLALDLEQIGAKKVEYITTQNKGFRANGDRHPHSWSIVDTPDLIQWILE